MCYQDCPEGFPDLGIECLKPPSYGRGYGYPDGEEDECFKDNHDLGCE